jgi:predicted dehydrogenase
MIKIGIVGTGGIAEWHAKEFQKIPDSTVISACDVSKERLNFFCDKFDIRERYNSVEGIASKIRC